MPDNLPDYSPQAPEPSSGNDSSAGPPGANEQEPAEQEPAEQEPAEQEPAEQEPAEQEPADLAAWLAGLAPRHSIIKPCVVHPLPAGQAPRTWRDAVWWEAKEIAIVQFHGRSSAHRPRTWARLLYNETTLYVHFRVVDRFVRCVHQAYQSPVCEDSCVEFFVNPTPARAGSGYFNFEVNCGGALHVSYIEDPRRVGSGFAKATPVDPGRGATVGVVHSLPRRIEPELSYGVEWHVALSIPLALLEHYAGPVGDPAGQEWLGNFYKCADRTSHPHWASWMPLGQELNFHRPRAFGVIQFAPRETVGAG